MPGCQTGEVWDGIFCVSACSSGARYDSQAGGCVPICAPGTESDPGTGECIPACQHGTERDPTSGECRAVCGAGSERSSDTGRCVPVCTAGTERDVVTGECIPVCVSGTHRAEDSGACIPDSAACPSGEVFDPFSGVCVDAATFCAEETTWVASSASCVLDEYLRTADLYEGTGENDPTFGGQAALELIPALPAIGSTLTLAGAVSAPADLDGDGRPDPDIDYWAFEISGPTLLRITADGLGGMSSGFAIARLEGDLVFERFGVGTTSTTALRDVYLPLAGTYAIKATDAMNFLSASSGTWFGGIGFGYFITIETRPLPTPTVLDVSSLVERAGLWPLVPPDTGSMLGFFSFTAESLGLYRLSLTSSEPTSSPILVAATDAGVAFAGEAGNAGIATAGVVLLVADHVYWFGAGNVPFSVEVEQVPSVPIPGTTIDRPISQDAYFASNGALPWTRFAFAATAGTVVSLHVTSTTSPFRAVVTDAQLEEGVYYGEIDGDGSTPSEDAWIRFYVPISGVFTLSVLGLSGRQLNPDSGSIFSIPAQAFDVHVDLFAQVPHTVGRITSPYAVPGAVVTSMEWERFYVLSTGAGDVIEFRGEGAVPFAPVITLYDLTLGPLRGKVCRAPCVRRYLADGQVLVGVADTTRSAGTYDLALRPVQFTELGPLAADSPIVVTGTTLTNTEARRVFTFTAAGRGVATIVATPSASLDLALIQRTVEFDAFSSESLAGPGLAETYEPYPLDVGQTVFFDVATANGLPPDADKTVDLTVTLGNTPSTMRFVPAGPFVMGSDSSEGANDERPEHVVTLSEFYIDQRETTTAEYRRCIAACACTAPASIASITRPTYFTDPLYDAYPVVRVTWAQATAYCAWAGKRLPTEAEWEKAARGGCEIVAPATCGTEDERNYPWGTTSPSCSLANHYLSGTTFCVAGGDTAPVGARSPVGDSPYGVQDMAGNVWEWVSDWHSGDYSWCAGGCTNPSGLSGGTYRVLRGGSANNVASAIRTAQRLRASALTAHHTVGFRCAYTP